ncbi:MAG TPA: hypothetical protein VLC08_15925, partial [Chitinolyticbacter sp.]|nr:hypothetical protein [Chitinolyticbacter sp.]
MARAFLPLLRDIGWSLLRQLRGLLHWHWRVVRWALLAGVVLLGCLAAGWQFYVVPRLDVFRPTIEAKFSAASGSRITIAGLAGG